jgi:hypothetical protein
LVVVASARREENDVEKHGRVEPHRHDEIALNRHTVALMARRADAKFDGQTLARTVYVTRARRANVRSCAKSPNPRTAANGGSQSANSRPNRQVSPNFAGEY